MKVISWNLLRRTGATVDDLAALIEREYPDLLLLQEATVEVETLPAVIGGHLRRTPLPGRIYGLAAWSRKELGPSRTLALPESSLPGRVPQRRAQLVNVDGIAFANVHLSHGQMLNRRQLLTVARALEGPAAIIGDYNAVGPTVLAGFRDVGPRRPTHATGEVRLFRLDRCLARDVRCARAGVLDRGPSDHHPIVLHLEPAPASLEADDAAAPIIGAVFARRWPRRMLRRGVGARSAGDVVETSDS